MLIAGVSILSFLIGLLFYYFCVRKYINIVNDRLEDIVAGTTKDSDESPAKLELHTLCETGHVLVDVYGEFKYTSDVWRSGTVLMCHLYDKYEVRKC